MTIHTARPGVIIGKKGADIEKLRRKLAAMTDSEVHLNIVEIRKPEIDATLVAESIAQQLERRVAFRRAMKRAVQTAMRLGALGHPDQLRGPSRRRRNRADRMVSRGPGAAAHAARRHRLRRSTEAKTAYGIIGVKVWIFKGEILEHDPMAPDDRQGRRNCRTAAAAACAPAAAGKE